MKQWTWAGAFGGLAGAVVWLHSIGALPAGFLYWAVIVVMIMALSYGISWGVTEAIKRQRIPKPWDTNGNKKRIYRLAMIWAALPAASAAAGIALTHDVPPWYWLMTPWVVGLLAVSSPWVWRLVFEVLWPRGEQ